MNKQYIEQVENKHDKGGFMKNSPRMKVVSICVGAALAQMAGSALADSGVGVDTMIGNAMNPGYARGPVQMDSDVPFVKRTPSGQMYNFPPDRGEVAAGGSVTGNVEIGYIHADDSKRYSKLNEYSDPEKDGLYLNNFGLSLDAADSALFYTMDGGAVGQKDQFYNASVGIYNSWKVKAFYSETPHVFSDTFIPRWIDNGTITPVAGVLTDPMIEVGLVRKKGGARADVNLSENWLVFVSAAEEKREGARPFGLQGGGEGIEPVYYNTKDFIAGTQYRDGGTMANVTYSLSSFTNQVSYLTVGNGYVLAPDNEAWNLKGQFSQKLGVMNGRINASASTGSSTQDAGLMAMTGGIPTPATLADGRTTSGLRIDTGLYDISMTLNPLEMLGVKASYRHYETKNKSGFAYTALPAFPATPAANTNREGTAPRDYEQDIYGISADFDLEAAGSIEAGWEAEKFTHNYRERDETTENRYKLGYVNTVMDIMTVRTSYEDARKRGSYYDPLGTERGVGAWLYRQGYAGTPMTAIQTWLAGGAVLGVTQTPAQIQALLLSVTGMKPGGDWQKTDQADRDQQTLNLRVNVAAADNLDIGFMGQIKDAKYPANVRGVTVDNLNTLSVDANWQPSTATQLSGYATMQRGKTEQVANTGGIQATATITAACGGPLIVGSTIADVQCMLNNLRNPLTDMATTTKNENSLFGVSLNQAIGTMQLGVDFSHSLSVGKISQAGAPVLAGFEVYPDMVTRTNSLDVNLLIPVTKQFSTRLMYNYEQGTFDDWHYLPSVLATSAAAASDFGPEKFRVHSIGVFLNYKL
ncbi:MAG TPA: MtrB/PioB family outer membrane beta-barrel protein [Gallionella sp.]|nr:MtrB/PioB family outer membrane beta-barrel protein [Gallionella sp.]